MRDVVRTAWGILIGLLTCSVAEAVEEIELNVLPVSSTFEIGHMEGGALDAKGHFYFTNNPRKVRGIQRLDLTSSTNGVELAYPIAAGGTWIQGGKMTFCSSKSVSSPSSTQTSSRGI